MGGNRGSSLPFRAYACLRSLCAAKNQAECHYRRRRPRSRPPATSTSRTGSSSTPAGDPRQGYDYDDGDTRARSSSPSSGRSFWRTGADMAADDIPGARVLVSPTSSSGTGDGCVPGGSLPLKRQGPRLSVSRKTSTKDSTDLRLHADSWRFVYPTYVAAVHSSAWILGRDDVPLLGVV